MQIQSLNREIKEEEVIGMLEIKINKPNNKIRILLEMK
jgi:hypothetical protein